MDFPGIRYVSWSRRVLPSDFFCSNGLLAQRSEPPTSTSHHSQRHCFESKACGRHHRVITITAGSFLGDIFFTVASPKNSFPFLKNHLNQKPPWIFWFKMLIIGKMVVKPLGWRAPSCLTPQEALQKGIYPINTHYIRCKWGWLLRGHHPKGFSHHFPYELIFRGVDLVPRSQVSSLGLKFRSSEATRKTPGNDSYR